MSFRHNNNKFPLDHFPSPFLFLSNALFLGYYSIPLGYSTINDSITHTDVYMSPTLALLVQ